MPLYEYECDNQHRSEEIFFSYRDAPDELACPHCGATAHRLVSCPQFKLGWVIPVVDSAKEIWAGTPLEGTDGKNPLYYKSKRLQFDMAGKAKSNGEAKAE